MKTRVLLDFAQNREKSSLSRVCPDEKPSNFEVENRGKTAVFTLFPNLRKSGKNGDFALILHVSGHPGKVAKIGPKCKKVESLNL